MHVGWYSNHRNCLIIHFCCLDSVHFLCFSTNHVLSFDVFHCQFWNKTLHCVLLSNTFMLFLGWWNLSGLRGIQFLIVSNLIVHCPCKYEFTVNLNLSHSISVHKIPVPLYIHVAHNSDKTKLSSVLEALLPEKDAISNYFKGVNQRTFINAFHMVFVPSITFLQKFFCYKEWGIRKTHVFIPYIFLNSVTSFKSCHSFHFSNIFLF